MFSWFLTQRLSAEWWLTLNTGYLWIVWWRQSCLPGGELNHPSPAGGPDGVLPGDSAEQALLSQKPLAFAMSISSAFPVLGPRPREAQLRLWASPSDLTPQVPPRDALGETLSQETQVCLTPTSLAPCPAPWRAQLQGWFPWSSYADRQPFSRAVKHTQKCLGVRDGKDGGGEKGGQPATPAHLQGQAGTRNYFLMCRSWNLDFLSL